MSVGSIMLGKSARRRIIIGGCQGRSKTGLARVTEAIAGEERIVDGSWPSISLWRAPIRWSSLHGHAGFANGASDAARRHRHRVENDSGGRERGRGERSRHIQLSSPSHGQRRPRVGAAARPNPRRSRFT